jgi:glycine cleavage system H protein
MTTIGYTKDHEYARVEDGVATIGISNYAQAQLGDIVFVDLPPVGKKLAKGDSLAVIESVKAASDVYSPVGGDVVEVNAELGGAPGLVNDDPLNRGWLVKLRLAAAPEGMMDQAAYDAFVGTL